MVFVPLIEFVLAVALGDEERYLKGAQAQGLCGVILFLMMSKCDDMRLRPGSMLMDGERPLM